MRLTATSEIKNVIPPPIRKEPITPGKQREMLLNNARQLKINSNTTTTIVLGLSTQIQRLQQFWNGHQEPQILLNSADPTFGKLALLVTALSTLLGTSKQPKV
jgi:replicative DNA helicase